MTEMRPEELQMTWLDDQQIQSFGTRLLPITIAQGEPLTQRFEEAETIGDTLSPSVFSNDSISLLISSATVLETKNIRASQLIVFSLRPN